MKLTHGAELEECVVAAGGTQGLLHDSVLSLKQRAVGHTFALLANKPEQEKNLLAMLVDKLVRVSWPVYVSSPGGVTLHPLMAAAASHGPACVRGRRLAHRATRSAPSRPRHPLC